MAELAVVLVRSGPNARERYLNRWDNEDAESKATTDAQGRFVFEDVPSGTWLVGPASTRDSEDPFDANQVPSLAKLLQVEQGAADEHMVLTTYPSLAIRGRVMDTAGAPRAGVWVRATSEELASVMDVRSDEDGRFAVGPLAPGSYRLIANGRGDTTDSEARDAIAGSEEDLLLTLQPGAEIRGRVLDHSTGEARQAELRLIDADAPLGYVRWGHSTREGHFRLEALKPGQYHLLARCDDGGIALLRDLKVTPLANLEAIELRLKPGGILEISGAPELKAQIGFNLRFAGLAVGHGYVGAGKTSEQVVFPGVTTIIYSGDRGGESELEVELVAGERRKLKLPSQSADDR